MRSDQIDRNHRTDGTGGTDRADRADRADRDDRDRASRRMTEPMRAGAADGDPELRDRANPVGSRGDGELSGSWQDIKSRFVDDPAGAVAEAEELVRRAIDERIRALQAEAEAVCAADRDSAADGASSTEALRARLIRLQAYGEQLAASSAH
ncbi:MAG TPA: hypothetical protein VGD37_21590 [Kofleriaceae bacterium]